MMKPKELLISHLSDFLSESEVDDEWMENHTSFEFDDVSRTVTIVIDNMNEQEYKWQKE